MKVQDVMTREVVTVQPGASLKDAAALLIANRISGLPVVDGQGGVLGVFSEADLLFKEQGEPDSPGWLSWLIEPLAVADRKKLEARVVGEAMTTPAQTISPTRPIAGAAKLMLGAGVNRLPVLENGKLVGIVTRADLVRAFNRSDAELAREIRTEVLERALWLDSATVQVEVAAGEVTLAGTLDNRADTETLPALVALVPGVIDVHSQLSWRDPDPER